MADFVGMADLLRAVGCGANAHEVCTVGNGVFFVREGPARIFADRYSKDLIPINDNALSGWLARDRPGARRDDDPLIQVIKRALEDEGLASE